MFRQRRSNSKAKTKTLPNKSKISNKIKLWGPSFNRLPYKEKVNLLASFGFRRTPFPIIPNSSVVITTGFTYYDGYRSHNKYFILRWKDPNSNTISQRPIYAIEYAYGLYKGKRVIIIRSVQRVGEEQCKDPAQRAKLLERRDTIFEEKFGIRPQTYTILSFLSHFLPTKKSSLFFPNTYLFAPSNPQIHKPIRDRFFMSDPVEIKIYDRRNAYPNGPDRAFVIIDKAYPLNLTKPGVASILFNLPQEYIPAYLKPLFGKP